MVDHGTEEREDMVMMRGLKQNGYMPVTNGKDINKNVDADTHTDTHRQTHTMTPKKPLHTTIAPHRVEVQPSATKSHRHTHPHQHRDDEIQYNDIEQQNATNDRLVDIHTDTSNSNSNTVSDKVNDRSPLLASSKPIDASHQLDDDISNAASSSSSSSRLSIFKSLPHSLSTSILNSGNGKSLCDNYSTVAVADEDAHWIKKLLAYTGMGLMVAVGYIDPGNWATDLAGGARFGYTLLFVILLSNACAVVLQHLALKLGVATNRDLAQTCRDQLHPTVNFILWILCEIAIGACDLAEVIGSAIAINLLFGLPLPLGCIITAADVLLILLLEQSHIRYLEVAVAALMLVIAGCFVAVISMSAPVWSDVLSGFLPHSDLVNNSSQLLVGLSILGATVMPHNLYLHSHLVMTRAFPRTVEGKSTAIRYATLDSTLSLAFAFVVNCMILILAASVFHNTEHSDVADLDDAYRLLTPALGTSASFVFALALLASGQNSTITGTLAGQIVFEGFLEIQVAPWLRRLLTRGLAIIPATIVASIMGAQAVNQMLIFSQLVLSLQLGFAVIPLIYFTSNEELMGKDHVNSKRLTIVGMLMSLGIVALNIFLVAETLAGNTP